MDWGGYSSSLPLEKSCFTDEMWGAICIRLYDKHEAVADVISTKPGENGSFVALIRVDSLIELIQAWTLLALPALNSVETFCRHGVPWFAHKQELGEADVEYKVEMSSEKHVGTVASSTGRVRCFRFVGGWRPSVKQDKKLEILKMLCSLGTMSVEEVLAKQDSFRRIAMRKSDGDASAQTFEELRREVENLNRSASICMKLLENLVQQQEPRLHVNFLLVFS